MQFEIKEQTNDFMLIIFTGDMINMKQKVINTFKDYFGRIGGEVSDVGIWKFPYPIVNCMTIQYIIKNTCFECGGLMKDGQALDNTWVNSEDFGGDSGEYGTTQSKIGHPTIKKVRKCTVCGHSHT